MGEVEYGVWRSLRRLATARRGGIVTRTLRQREIDPITSLVKPEEEDLPQFWYEGDPEPDWVREAIGRAGFTPEE
jgi:hypothetical protein